MELQSLLSLLADGKFHSGSELGRELGVSRTAIWKALSRFSELSLDVETVKGKGYRINGGLDLLCLGEIQSLIKGDSASLCDLYVLLSVDSTNSWLQTKTDLVKPYSFCLAEMQLSGRGRRGREWVSPFGKNIYLSVRFDLQGGIDALNGLSLVIGIAIIRSLKSLGLDSCSLKWPNDVLVEGKKIAGILVELQGEPTTGWQVTAGLGLNVLMTQEEGRSIDQEWAASRDYIGGTRNQIVSVLMKDIVTVIEEFKSKGFAAYTKEWAEYDGLHGCNVVVLPGGCTGVASGIDHAGALLINTGDGMTVVNAGEVSIRKS